MDVVHDTQGRRLNDGDDHHDLEVEDDAAFYAQLVRQVLILTAEDDDDDDVVYSVSSSSHPPAGRILPDAADSVPVVKNGGRGTCGGTGVFIPLTAATSRRKRNPNGKRGSNGSKQQPQKMVEKNRS